LLIFVKCALFASRSSGCKAKLGSSAISCAVSTTLCANLELQIQDLDLIHQFPNEVVIDL